MSNESSLKIKINSINKGQVRTKEERNAEVRDIVRKLTELRITIEFEAVRKLFKMMSTYVADGTRQEINIDFPEFSRKIRGVLATSSKEPVWVKLEKKR